MKKLEHALDQVRRAIGDLQQEPPNRDMAANWIKLAIRDIEHAVQMGVITPETALPMYEALSSAARILTAEAIAGAAARDGNTVVAQQLLAGQKALGYCRFPVISAKKASLFTGRPRNSWTSSRARFSPPRASTVFRNRMPTAGSSRFPFHADNISSPITSAHM